MDPENKSIQELVHEYQHDFVPRKKKLLEELRLQEENTLISLVKAIHKAIPEGKWKTFFDNRFWFLSPAEERVMEDDIRSEKYSMYWTLKERMPPAAGVYLMNFYKQDVLAAGFTSWKDFYDSLKELNAAVKDIVIFFSPTRNKKDIRERDVSLTICFDTTIQGISEE